MLSRSFFPLLFCLLLIALLGGCATHQQYVINPDGSGKLIVKNTLNPNASADDARKTLVTAVLGATGIDGFRDLAITQDNGRAVLTYTAYFKDVTKARVGSETSGPLSRIEWKRDAQGRLVGTLATSQGAMTAPASQPVLDGPALDAAVRKIKAEMGFSPIPLREMSATFVVRAAVEKATGFKPVEGKPEAGYTVEFDGAKADDAMKALVADEAGLKAMLKQAGPYGVRELLNNRVRDKLMGTSEPLEITLAATGKPVFDYAAEVAAAKPATIATLIESGIIAKEPPAAPPEGGFAALKLESATRSSGPDVWLRFSATLPFAAVEVEKSVYSYVLDDAGNYLLPAIGRLSEASGGYISQDHDINFSLTLPTRPESKKIARIVGVCRVGTASGKREVDLGTIELKAGATGKVMGLKIDQLNVQTPFAAPRPTATGPASPTSAPAPQMQYPAMISVSMDKQATGIKEIRFKDDTGKTLFTFSHQPGKPWTQPANLFATLLEPLPASATAVATVYDDYKTVELPIDLKDIDLPAPAAPATPAPAPKPLAPAATQAH